MDIVLTDISDSVEFQRAVSFLSWFLLHLVCGFHFTMRVMHSNFGMVCSVLL